MNNFNFDSPMDDIFKTPQSQLSFSTELKNVILARNILTSRTRKKVINALEDISKTHSEQKRSDLREKCVEEILSSERAYLNQLELILKNFSEPLRSKKILPYDDYNTIFGNIDPIYNINKELLSELEDDSNGVARAFLKIAPFFKLYSVYAYDYKNSLTLLQENETGNQEFCKFLEQQENLVNMKLSALLITPIQRIPRYRLLLKQLLAYTLPSDEDYKMLKDSLAEVERVAFHINSLVQDQENSQRLLELQRSLCARKPMIVKPGRRLIKEGLVMKMSQNGSHGCQRYLILLSDIVMYCKVIKSKPTEPNSLQCCCILPLHKCRITEIASKGVFTITCQNEALMFYCDTASDVDSWISELQLAINKYIDCRKTLRKDSSSRKPIRKRNIVEFDEEMLSPGQLRRKRRILPFKPDFETVVRMDSESPKKSKRVKRAKLSGEIKDMLYPLRQIQNRIKTIPEGQEIHDFDETNKNIQTFGLQRHQNQDETAFTKIRDYFFSVGQSIKNIFQK